MPEQIISASGVQYGLVITSEGAAKVNVTGSIVIGSVSAQVESIYVQSGTFFQASGNTYIVSGGILEVSGTYFPGSVYQGTAPWIILGSQEITNLPSSYPGSVSQLTDPWIVLGSQRVIQDTTPWVISGLVTGSVRSQTIQGTVPWITLGSETTPLATYKTNPAFEYEYANGDDITKIVQFIETGSYVQDITYSGGLIVKVGSYY